MIYTLGLCSITLFLFYVTVVIARKIALYRSCHDELTIRKKRFTIAVLTPSMQSPANLFLKDLCPT